MSAQTSNHRPRRPARRGVTIILVMIYMVLFSVLALGFYASVQTATQVAGNEQRANRALHAAESGMSFIKYHLANLDVPANTPPNNLFMTVYSLLKVRLEGKLVLSVPGTVGTTSATQVAVNAPDNDTVTIPHTGTIRSDSVGSSFKIVISKLAGGQQLRVLVTGNFNGARGARNVQLDYAVAQNAADIFNFGVASKSRIVMNSNAKIVGASEARLGSVLSTSSQLPTLNMSGDSQVSGDISFSSAGAQLATSSNATVAGLRSSQSGFDAHVHSGVSEPEFPTINTDAFKPFAGNPAYGGTTIDPPPAGGERKFDSGTIRNPLIKANPDPNSWITFDSSVKVEGVIYIETPNRVRFLSNSEVRGAIVVQNNPTGDYNRNSLVFDSNAKILPIESLPDNNANYPEAMQQLTGAAILAPKFDLHVNSNFGSTGGSIIADRIHLDSNATGIIRGSVINLADTMLTMNSNADITIESMGTANYPAGVVFGKHYVPLPATYAEGAP